MDYNERISQCDVDIARLQDEKARLVKEKEKNEEKIFYIGEIYPAFFDGVVKNFMLVKLYTNNSVCVALIGMDEQYKGEAKHRIAPIPIHVDSNGKKYTKYLPTSYPSDFGLDRKYAWKNGNY